MITKDNAKEYLPIIQALAEGKTIQVLGITNWHDITSFILDAPPHEYRIKPEPETFYIWRCKACTFPYGIVQQVLNKEEDAVQRKAQHKETIGCDNSEILKVTGNQYDL